MVTINASGEVFLFAFAPKKHGLMCSVLGTEFGASLATACPVKKRRCTKAPVHMRYLGQRVCWCFGIFPLLNELCSLQMPWATSGFLRGCPPQVMQNQIKNLMCAPTLPPNVHGDVPNHCPGFGGCSVPHPSPQAMACPSVIPIYCREKSESV